LLKANEARRNVMPRLFLIVPFLLAATPVLAGTRTLAAGPLLSTSQTDTAICAIFNGGDQTITVSKRKLYDQDGNAITPGVEGCQSPLLKRETCAFSAANAQVSTWSCRAVIKGDDLRATGTLSIRRIDNTIIEMVPLQRLQ
jgi:hypothetical protein